MRIVLVFSDSDTKVSHGLPASYPSLTYNKASKSYLVPGCYYTSVAKEPGTKSVGPFEGKCYKMAVTSDIT